MATRSTSITEPRTAPSPWPGPACDLCWIGWILTAVANGGSARRIYEAAGISAVYLWLPAPPYEPRVHHQAPDIQGLLRLWAGIRIARRPWSSRVRPYR